MEGVLLKWVNYIFGWRERYFVLKGNILYYYYKKGEKPKGKIHLTVSQLNQTNDPEKFEIDTGLNVIYIKAASKEVKDEWIRAIKIAKLEGENKLQGNIFGGISIPNKEINKDDLEYNSNVSNKNSVITEDKLLKKINLISRTVDKLAYDNSSMSSIANMTDNNFSFEMKKIVKDNNVKYLIFNLFKVNVRNLQEQLRDLKRSFVSFNRDFIKLSEHFFNFKGAEQNYLNNHKNFVDDNNNIEYARAGVGVPNLEFDDNINININLPNSNDGEIFEKTPSISQKSFFLDSSNRIYQKDEDIFYAVSDNNENDIEAAMNQKNKNANKITENKKKPTSKMIEEESIPIKLSKELVPVKVENKFYDSIYVEKRKFLPALKKELKINVWSILKDAVGKDLSKFCVPGIYFIYKLI